MIVSGKNIVRFAGNTLNPLLSTTPGNEQNAAREKKDSNFDKFKFGRKRKMK